MDFNVNPYFDDNDPDKNFYKVLFRPGRPVQTRELNQIQTILQNQVSNFADHMFKNGSMIIPGHVYYDNKIVAIKLKAQATTATGGLSADVIAPSLVGLTIVGASTGVKAKVIHYNLSTTTDSTTIYVKIAASGTLGESLFADAESIVAESDAGLIVEALDAGAYSNSSLCTIDEGIYYVNGTFVKVLRQIIAIEKYSNTPTWRIGLSVTEEIVTSDTDESLFDNALGYTNYGAPGADRYKISLVLEKRSFEDADNETDNIEKFIDILHVKGGDIIYKINKTEYAELEKLVARRTFDESGDYEVNPFGVNIYDYRSNDRGTWAAGVAYVVGDVVKNTLGEVWKAVTSGISGATEPTQTSNVFKQTDGGVSWIFTSSPIYNSGISTLAGSDLDVELSADQSMVYEISEGKAYIKGFEVEKQGKTKLVSPKATEYENVTDEVVPTNSGIRVSVVGMSGVPDINTYQKANIYYYNVAEVTAWTVKRTATVALTISGGVIIGADITDPGFGYDRENPPTLSITVGTGAVIKLHVNQASEVSFAKILSGGTGYTGAVATVAAPPAIAPKIGTCFIRSCEYNVGSGVIGSGTETYTLEVFNVNLNEGYSWEVHARSLISDVTTPLTRFSANVEQYRVKLSGSTSVTSGQSELLGVGTNYTTELMVGQYISAENAAGSLTNRVSSLLTITNNVAAVTHDWSATKTDCQLFALYSNIDAGAAGSLVSLPYMFVRSIRSQDDTSHNIKYSVKRLIPVSTDGAGVLTVTLAPDETFGDIVAGNFIVSYINGVTPTTSNPIATTSLNPGKNVVTITGLVASTNYEMLCTVNKFGFQAKEKAKTLTRKVITVTDKPTIDSLVMSLGEADIYNLISVKVSGAANAPMVGDAYPAYSDTSAQDITDYYNWSDGQTMSAYDIGKIVRKKGKVPPSNSLQIVFEYFEHSAGDYFSVDSYKDIPYAEIRPVFRDMLDFRPRVSDAGDSYTGTGSSFTEPMAFGTYLQCDYSYYLPRKDVIVLDASKNFTVLQGPSGYQLKGPNLPDDAVTIASVIVAPGPLYANAGIHNITKQDMRRYTMKDIGKIEKRVATLEYYSQLSMLENDAFKQSVVDQNGMDRFKAGILADDFSSQQVADFNNPDFSVAFDTDQQELRAFKFDYNFELQSLDVLDTQRYTKNYKATGDIYSLQYSEVLAVSQTQASSIISVNPFDVITWVGAVNLYPDRDTWIQVDNTTEPDITINSGGGMLGAGSFGVQWNSVSAIWGIRSQQNFSIGSSISRSRAGSLSNIPLNTALTGNGSWAKNSTSSVFMLNGQWKSGSVNNAIDSTTLAGVNAVFNTLGGSVPVGSSWIDMIVTKTGTRTTTGSETITRDEVARIAVDPFVRSRPIVFTARNLKPNTAFSVSFDNRNVSDRCATLIELVIPSISNATLKTFVDSDIVDMGSTVELVRSTNTKNDPRHPLMSGNNMSQGSDVYWDRGDVITQPSGVRGLLVDKYINTAGATVLVIFNTTNGSWAAGTAASVSRNGISYSLGTVSTVVASKQFNATTKPLSTAAGKMYGVYYLPYTNSMKFSALSNKSFLLTEITNSTIISTTPSVGAAIYSANGTIEYKRTVTSNVITLMSEQVTQTDIVSFSAYRPIDPVAQTFTLTDKEPNGAFITSVDLYIASVKSSSSQPIIVEIRNTVNGYPGQEILAVSEKTRSQVGTSNIDATTPKGTNFILKDPITNLPTMLFLNPLTEYAVVVRSEDSSWHVWLAQMGEERKDAAGRGSSISQQPTLGSFFKSQNASTWTADQYADLTFRINKAKFITNVACDIVFKNKNILRETLVSNAFIAVTGSSKVRVDHPGHGFINGDKVRMAGVLKGPFTAIATTYLGGATSSADVIFTVANVDYDSYVIDIAEISGGVAAWSGYFGGGAVIATHQLQYNTLAPNLQIWNPTNTDFSVGLRPMYGRDVAEVLPYITLDDFEPVINRENTHFTTPMLVAAAENEAIKLGTEKSFLLRVVMTSQDENLSPVLDYRNSAVTLVRNRINSPSFDDNNAVFDYVTIATLGNIDYNFDEVSPKESYFETTDTALFKEFDKINPGNVVMITAGTTANVGKDLVVLSKENMGSKYRVYVDGSRTTFIDETTTTTTAILGTRYVDETAQNTTSFSTYVHKAMTLTVPSTIINVLIDANLPPNSGIEIYQRTTLQSAGKDINDVSWVKMEPSRALQTVSNFTEFTEYQFTAADIAAFDVCQTKIVFLSPNDAVTPRVKNLRVMALA